MSSQKSLLTRSQFEGQLKEKSKVISDLKVKEGKDIDTMIEMDKQIKFLNEILYKRNQSIQTIHMLAPKCATYNGRSTFANPKYLKRAQSDKPRLYEIPYDTSDPANRFCPDGEETVTLEKESRSKLDKDKDKKILDDNDVSFDELSAMAFEQAVQNPGLQSMTSGQNQFQVSLLLMLQSTIQLKKPTEDDLDLLFEAIEGFIDVISKAMLQLKKATIWVKASTRGMYDELVYQLFSDLMKSRFEMSMMGEMTFFLGLQVNQSPRGIFINQSNYVLEILKKYGMESCDPVGTPMEIKDKLDLDQNGSPAKPTGSTQRRHLQEFFGGAQFLGGKVWLAGPQRNKTYCALLSTAEAEYVLYPFACAQVLWMQTLLTDMAFTFNRFQSTVIRNQHSHICNPASNIRTKHIAVATISIKEHLERVLAETLYESNLCQLERNDGDSSSKSGNDAHVDDADIRPIYDEEPLVEVSNTAEYNVFADERAALANLIANLTLVTEENKMILKQLKKENASLTQELKECKTNLDKTNSARGEATSYRDSCCLIALQNKQTEFEKYKAFKDRTIDYEILQTKLNETLGLLALKDTEIKESLKTKDYEISVFNQKHDELVKKSLLTKSQLEGRLKEKTKVIWDLNVKEGKDIDKMIEMDKQLKFLNEIVYKRNQSIQTIHMLAPRCSTYNGRPTFANPKYLKKAQSEKPCLYEIPYDTSDLANRFAPDREETMTLETESRSKLNKDKVKPYDYTKQNSLYEIFKTPSLEYLYQLERAKEVRKTMWRKPFVRTKPNIAKNVAFLPVLKSISKSRQAYNDMTNNFNHFRTICQQTWSNHTSSAFTNPTAKSMEVLIKILLMPLSDKTNTVIVIVLFMN
ncbi:gag-pol polyprotein [Tanacetum coccineum]